MTNKLEPYNLIHTPKDWDEIERWINRHPKDERGHLIMAALMTWNLACKLAKDE